MPSIAYNSYCIIELIQQGGFGYGYTHEENDCTCYYCFTFNPLLYRFFHSLHMYPDAFCAKDSVWAYAAPACRGEHLCPNREN